MRIEEFDFKASKQDIAPLISALFKGDTAAFVIRNFLPKEQLNLIRDKNLNYTGQKFEPSLGYTALPRPFGGILGPDRFTSGYEEEIKYFKEDLEFKVLEDSLKASIGVGTNNQAIEFAQESDHISYSNSWFSLRELQPEQGRFDVHCGNFFVDWNERYFQKNNKQLEAYSHKAFLVMIQKPTAAEDLIIYSAHWDKFKTRKDLDTLIDLDNREHSLKHIPCSRITLNEGDVIFFDESNYWHQVPIVNGEISRITFGGFISKFKNQNKYYFWA